MSEQYSQNPGSMLDIRPSFFPLAFLLYFFKPYYSINGSPATVGQWKQNNVPVPPGQYHVSVWLKYLFRPQMGLSTIVVNVPPGAAAVVTWRAPHTIFGTGRIAIVGVGPLADPHMNPGQTPPAGHMQGGQQGGQMQGGQTQGGQTQDGQTNPAPGSERHQQPSMHTTPQSQPSQSAPGGWHADPTGRHQVRYFDGLRWTEHVGDGGIQARDPIS